MRPNQADRITMGDNLTSSGQRRSWHMPFAPFPRFIQLETITKCNARCPFCPQHEIQRDPALMPPEVWRKIATEARGRGVIYRPFLTNEPFVDKRMPAIVRTIKELDPSAKIEFNTNGELLTEELSRVLLDGGVDIMRFSIDGLSRETYEPSRLGVSYDKVMANVQKFLKLWREGKHQDLIHTEVRMIEVPENSHEVAAYREFWEPQCSEVVITNLYQWPWTGQGPQDVVRKPCLKVLDELFFYSNGNATICCWDVHERAVIGNIREQTVQEIWEGHAACSLRGLLDDGRRDLIHLCSRCNAYADYDFSRFAVTPAGKQSDR